VTLVSRAHWMIISYTIPRCFGATTRLRRTSLTTIHVVRMISQLLRSLQSQTISPQALLTFDSHFASCQNVFPAHCQIYHPQPLEPRHLSPICQLQNCRIVLHRHNLSTSCPAEVRAAALQSCLKVAKETVHLLARVRQYQPPSQITWRDAVASAATTMVCAHIWRCMLFLCFSAFYDEALVCADICAAIGDFRQMNVSCGRNLYGFLRQVASRIAQGTDLMQDEMMIALVSGDVQGSTESSWVWNGSETGTALNGSACTPTNFSPSKEILQPFQNPTILTAEEMKEWSGWDHIQEIIKQLKREKKQRGYQQQSSAGPVTASSSAAHTPQAWDAQQQTQKIQPAVAVTAAVGIATQNTSSSRISIANII